LQAVAVVGRKVAVAVVRLFGVLLRLLQVVPLALAELLEQMLVALVELAEQLFLDLLTLLAAQAEIHQARN
jgi:hypothetical protein